MKLSLISSFHGLRACGLALAFACFPILSVAQASLIQDAQFFGFINERSLVQSPQTNIEYLGTKSCETKITEYIATTTLLLVKTSDRPKSCSFVDLVFVLEGKAYPLSGLDENFVKDARGMYGWKTDTINSFWMAFNIGKRLPSDALKNATGPMGVLEYKCSHTQFSSCLTSPRINLNEVAALLTGFNGSTTSKEVPVFVGNVAAGSPSINSGTTISPMNSTSSPNCNNTDLVGKILFGTSSVRVHSLARRVPLSKLSEQLGQTIVLPEENARFRFDRVDISEGTLCSNRNSIKGVLQMTRQDSGRKVEWRDVSTNTQFVRFSIFASDADGKVINGQPVGVFNTASCKVDDLKDRGSQSCNDSEPVFCAFGNCRGADYDYRDLRTFASFLHRNQPTASYDQFPSSLAAAINELKAAAAASVVAAEDRKKRDEEAAQKRRVDEAAREVVSARERREYESKLAKEEAEFNTLLRSASPRALFLSAVRFEDAGDRGKAKTVYRELMKRFPNAQETLLASQRLTRLGDVEAVESASSNAAARSESAAQGLRSQNYQQCMAEESSCYSRCSDIRNSSAASSCRNGCFRGCKQ